MHGCIYVYFQILGCEAKRIILLQCPKSVSNSFRCASRNSFGIFNILTAFFQMFQRKLLPPLRHRRNWDCTGVTLYGMRPT